MNYTFIALGLLVSLVPSSAVAAEDLESLSTGMQGGESPFQISLGHLVRSDIDGGPAAITANRVSVRAALPVARWDGGMVAANATYFLDAISLREPDLVDGGTYPMHTIGLGLIAMHRLNERWSLMAVLLPSLNSDFGEVDAGALFVQGVVQASWTIVDSFTLRFGVAGHAKFGYYMPVPRLGFVWQPHPRVHIDAILPKLVRVTHNTTDDLDLELFGGLESNIWEVNRSGLGNRAVFMRVTTGVAAKVALGSGLSVRVAGGVVPFSRLRSFDTESDEEIGARMDVTPFVDFQLLFTPADLFRK